MATQGSRGAYRTRTVALAEVATLAARLAALYSYEDADGRVEFEPEPVAPLAGNPADWRFRVVAAWHGLRAALCAAGVVAGEGVPLPLDDGTAQFLRVERLGEHSSGSPMWERVGLYEVLRGVSSYSYADGRALDVFLEAKRLQAVRVVREVVPVAQRVAYLGGDRSGVTLSEVVGELQPGQWNPDALGSGWAVIGDLSNDPEPGAVGVESAALVLPMRGPQGVPGSVGAQGPTGPQGPAGRGIVSMSLRPLWEAEEPGWYGLEVTYSDEFTEVVGTFRLPQGEGGGA